jgi:hypothetical protein
MNQSNEFVILTTATPEVVLGTCPCKNEDVLAVGKMYECTCNIKITDVQSTTARWFTRDHKLVQNYKYQNPSVLQVSYEDSGTYAFTKTSTLLIKHFLVI